MGTFRVINQKHEVIKESDPMLHIERIARVCYKSEDKIEKGSAAKMINILRERKHHAMLEHYRFIMEVNRVTYEILERLELATFRLTHDGRYVISFNVRSLINMVDDSNCEAHNVLPKVVECIRDDLIGHIVKKYGCNELFGCDAPAVLSIPITFIKNERSEMSAKEWTVHGWMSVLFTTDRGVTHEIVRHRLCSFAQESTRYVNYGKKDCLVFVKPNIDDENMLKIWEHSMSVAADDYLQLIDIGAQPQQARSVLPNSTKSDIVVTTYVEEWLHIFELRAIGTTGAPHPMMKELMSPLLTESIAEWYIKGDIVDGELNGNLKIGGDWCYV